jgi:hypothetical protein
MEETAANPIIIALLCTARCLVPLLVLFGISYILRRLGLISKLPQPPINNNSINHNLDEGDMANGTA